VPVQFRSRDLQFETRITFRASENIEFASVFELPVNSLDHTQLFGVDLLKPIQLCLKATADRTVHGRFYRQYDLLSRIERNKIGPHNPLPPMRTNPESRRYARKGFKVALAPFYDREDFRRFHVVISVSPLNSDGKAGFLLGTSRFGYIIRGRHMPWRKCRSFIRSMRPASQRQFVSIMTTIYVFRAFTYQQMSFATGRVIIGFVTIANT